MHLGPHAMAVASAMLLAFASIVWARTNSRQDRNLEIREGYADRVSSALRKAGIPMGAEYGEREQDVFEAFMKVHATPPTEPAMRHYVAVGKRYGLSKSKLIDRMTADMPTDDDYEKL